MSRMLQYQSDGTCNMVKGEEKSVEWIRIIDELQALELGQKAVL